MEPDKWGLLTHESEDEDAADVEEAATATTPPADFATTPPPAPLSAFAIAPATAQPPLTSRVGISFIVSDFLSVNAYTSLLGIHLTW